MNWTLPAALSILPALVPSTPTAPADSKLPRGDLDGPPPSTMRCPGDPLPEFGSTQAEIVGAGETAWYHYSLPSPFHAISVTFTSLSAGKATVDFGAYARVSGDPDFCHYIEPAACLRVLNRVACSVHGVVGDYNSRTYPAASYIVAIHNT